MQTIALAWNPSPDTNVTGYFVYYGTASGSYSTRTNVGNVTSTAIGALIEGTAYFFVATAYNASGLESDPSNEVSYTAPGPTAPTLDPIKSLAINEDTGLQTVVLSGITSGSTNQTQNLTVTATSSTPAIIPNPVVSYANPGTTGTLSFTPVPNASGSATITVTVSDGQTQNNTCSRTFTVTVNPVNDPPTLNPLSNVALTENAGSQTVSLSGITSGAANEAQTLTVTATSSAPAIIPSPVVSYTSPNSTGTLSFTPVPNASGSATIRVTVSDGQTQNNTCSRTFTVTVNPVNDPPTLNPLSNVVLTENAGSQTVLLSGITSGAASEVQALTVTATSSAPAIIPNPVVSYTSPDTTGTLSFTPVPNASGSATITVTVSDGQTQNSTCSRAFTVTVNAVNSPPTLSTIADQTTTVDTPTSLIAFSVSDPDTATSALQVSTTSSNPTLLPQSGIEIRGTDVNRGIILTPAAGQTGKTVVTVTVNDGSGASTTSFTLSVQPKQDQPVNVHFVIEGNGTLSPNLTNQSLTVGKTYAVTAIPATDQEFAGWSGSTNFANARITFVMTPNLVLKAKFVPSPFIPVVGTFRGLFNEADGVRQNSSGSFALTTTRKGNYSGSVQIGAVRYVFTGKMDLERKAKDVQVRRGLSTLTLNFEIDAGTDQLLGTLSDGSWTAPLRADRAVFHPTRNPTSLAGTYNVVFPGQAGNSTLPSGHGYGVVQVTPGGQVTITGTLGDGTAINRSTFLSRNGDWPLYVPLYGGNGSLFSWLTFSTTTTEDLSGATSWIKPANRRAIYYPEGFATMCLAVGSTYHRPPAGTGPLLNLETGELELSGGELVETLNNPLVIDSLSRVKDLGINKLTLTFSLANGTFRGSLLEPETRQRRVIRGISFQKLNAGYGLLLGAHQTSSALLK